MLEFMEIKNALLFCSQHNATCKEILFLHLGGKRESYNGVACVQTSISSGRRNEERPKYEEIWNTDSAVKIIYIKHNLG